MRNVFFDYLAQFGEVLNFPPCDFGHIAMTEEQLAQYAKDALASGKPIRWNEHFKVLAESTDS